MPKKTKKMLIVVLTLVSFAYFSYILISLKGLNFYGVYSAHIEKDKVYDSDNERYIDDLNFIYNEIKNNYVNLKYKEDKFNFKWDNLYIEALNSLKNVRKEADFYEIASKMIYKLHDGHSSFNYINHEPYEFNKSLYGILKVRYINNRPIIIGAYPDFTYGDINILGKEIKKINGVDFNTIVDEINEEYGRYDFQVSGRTDIVANSRFWEYFYKNGKEVPNILTFELLEYNGKQSTFQLDTTVNYPKVAVKALHGVNFGLFKSNLPSYYVIDEDISYIKIPTFEHERRFIKRRFQRIVEELKDIGTKAIIIDIRYNRGGNSSFRDVLSYLTDEEIVIANYRLRKSERFKDIYYFREIYENLRSDNSDLPKEKGYSKFWEWSVKPSKEKFLTEIPIVVLVNERVYSSASSFTKACLDYNLATVIGNTIPLSGYGLPTSIALPSNKYVLTYGFFEIRGLEGEHLENEYESIDIYSGLNLRLALQGRDSQLEDAVKYLKNKLSK